MDRSYASHLQAFSKATLLGLVLFSMVTWVPHACSCLRTFLFVSLPSAASAIVTRKCFFVISNIIVLLLASKSKLSQSDAQYLSGEDIDVIVGDQLEALAPVIKEKEGNYADEEIAKEEQEDSMVVEQDTLHQLDRCEHEDSSSTTIGVEELREEESDDVLLVNVGDGYSIEVEELGRVETREEVIVKEEREEEMGLPTDELNWRVEDFIARFNMERQLEARMLVCCC